MVIITINYKHNIKVLNINQILYIYIHYTIYTLLQATIFMTLK